MARSGALSFVLAPLGGEQGIERIKPHAHRQPDHKAHPKRCGYGPPLQGEADEQRASDEADRPQHSPHRVVGGMLRVFLLVDQREACNQYRGEGGKDPPIDSVVMAPISAATTEIVPPKAKRTAMSV